MAKNDNERTYTVKQLMERWTCSRKTVLDMIHNGQLATFKLGSRAHRVTDAEVRRIESEAA